MQMLSSVAMDETKIIYHIDEEETPYLMKIAIPPDRVTLGDLKNALNRPNYKYFFKSMDDDFGVVKEEITDDGAHLPCFNGRVVSWLVTAEESAQSDCQSVSGDNVTDKATERRSGQGDSRPSSHHHGHGGARNGAPQNKDGGQRKDEGEEMDSPHGDRVPPLRNFQDYKHGYHRGGRIYSNSSSHLRTPPSCETSSSMMSSDLESTSFFDSEDDSSRLSSITGTTMSSAKHGRHRKQRRRRRMPAISRASSFSSMTDSTMSLNIITVTLNMDTVNFLGISIVGQSNKGGDGGIYVGSIMKGGAVAMDGRIEPGDMILEVNGTSFDEMSNDDAVRSLREQVQKPGPITLVVAKCWDPSPKGYFTIPREEPVRPIDPRAWVLHTNAMTNSGGPGAAASLSTLTSTSSSLTSSLPESDQRLAGDEQSLSVGMDIASVVRSMSQPDSGLEVRDRMWLKITVPNAFIGSDLVDWLYTHVSGFADRRDARKYAANLLKFGYIRHTVNKVTFSEQCYYVFGDLAHSLSQLALEEVDSVSEVAAGDRMPPLHPPTWNTSGMGQMPVHSRPNYTHPRTAYAPPPAYVPVVSTAGFASPGMLGDPLHNASPKPAPYPGVAQGSGPYGGHMPPAQHMAPPPASGVVGYTTSSMLHQSNPSAALSVHSGSVVANCVCIHSTYKAVKNMLDTKEKVTPNRGQLKSTDKSQPGEPSISSAPMFSRPRMGTLSRSHASDESGSSASGSSIRGGTTIDRGKRGQSPGKQAHPVVSESGPPPYQQVLHSHNMVPPTATELGHNGLSNGVMMQDLKVNPAPVQPHDLVSQVSDDLRGSKQSFRLAMGNPSI